MTRRREKPLRFEIMRLDDVDGTPVDSTDVDAASLQPIDKTEASLGQRAWIRPSPPARRLGLIPPNPSTGFRPPVRTDAGRGLCAYPRTRAAAAYPARTT